MFDATPTAAVRPSVIATPASRLSALLSGPLMMFGAGEEIYAEGDKSGAIYQVAFGAVRVYRLLTDGRRQICAFHMPDEIFGFEAGAERHFFADAICATGLSVLRPGSEAELSNELLKLALRSLGRAHDHLLTVGRNDAAGRVAAFLLEMAERRDTRDDGVIELAMSRSDIADYLGLTIETVSRIMTKLKDARIIRMTNARRLDILRWDALEDMTA